MQLFKFNRGNTGMFDQQHLDLVYDQERFLPFISQCFSLNAFGKAIQTKGHEFSSEKRRIVADSLMGQYGPDIRTSVKSNIEKLKDGNTFTVTTGHQLSLYTGPLFFVIKILHVIKLCETLNKEYPENHFVPVYWMATEDHDFDEIDHLRVFNRNITWEHEKGGPVGRYSLSGIEAVKNELKELFANHAESGVYELIDSCNGPDYADAMRNMVDFLFGDRGLVIIDGDRKELKEIFKPVIKKELTEQFSFAEVERTNNELIREGVSIQVNPREMNLFYMLDGVRERIVSQEGKFSIANVGSFTRDEIIQILEEFPERFSPNVILRPLFQESILPNLAYIGGAGEIAYWLQLKRVFDACSIPYPLIQVRNSIVWVDRSVSSKKQKFDLQLEDIFKPVDLLKREYVESNEADLLDFDELERAKDELAGLMRELILGADPTLERYFEGEKIKLDKQIEGIRSKLIKASKSRHNEAMAAIDFVRDRLFPDGKIQERTFNLLHFCPQGNVEERVELLYGCIDPFEKDLIVIREA